ncbi:MAG TPA: ABC transporter ATP-binding protein [Anaerolineaceae bacterium]|nr:ABC transporter ATP-binding protein [Anaerolineaceae bacterium]
MVKALAKYIGQYKKHLFMAPILVLLDVVAELSIPILMSRIVDVGIPAGDTRYIMRTGIAMILLALGAIILGVANMKVSATAGQGFGANLRDALFAKVQEFSFANIDHFSTGSLVTRLTIDVNNLQNTLTMGVRLLLRSPMMLIVAMVLAYRINARLSIIIALAMPVLAIAIALIMTNARKRFTVMQARVDALNSTIQENLIGIRVVKSFVRQNYEKKKFKGANDALTSAAIHAASLVVISMPMMMLVVNAATLAIIKIGGGLVIEGAMGTGELISFISYVMQILVSIMMLSMIFLMLARAEASGKRIVEVLKTQVDIADPGEMQEGAEKTSRENPQLQFGKIEFRDVSFKYATSGTGENVLSDIRFVVQPGEVVGIVGGTATGKTSLVNLIPRLYDVTAGSVLVDDVDVRDYKLNDLRKDIGMVLQQNTLFSGTIRENLLWGNENASQEDLEQVCKDAQAHEFIMSFPDGYDTFLGQGGVNISGGQKQRLYIARAMLKSPKILILDDSTSAVDSATEEKIRRSFYSNFKDTTVLIIAQRISSVSKADKILVLDDGKLVGMGTHTELMQNNKIYQEINASQQEGVLNA